jgi:small subunit ribosomal protein S17
MPKRQLTGKVKNNSTDKTISVVVERKKNHPIYKKVVNFRKNFAAHDENNEANIGDTVLIEECAPKSKTKTWVLKEVLEKAI